MTAFCRRRKRQSQWQQEQQTALRTFSIRMISIRMIAFRRRRTRGSQGKQEQQTTLQHFRDPHDLVPPPAKTGKSVRARTANHVAARPRSA
jgi:hypothetical protein